MTVYKDKSMRTSEEIVRKEHAYNSDAKRVVDGPLAIPEDSGDVSLAPIQGALTAASVNLALEFKKVYRVIASQDAYFRLSLSGSTAVVGDIYLPANTPTTIQTEGLWESLDAIRVSTDGIIQAMEIR